MGWTSCQDLSGNTTGRSARQERAESVLSMRNLYPCHVTATKRRRRWSKQARSPLPRPYQSDIVGVASVFETVQEHQR